jgi:NADH-quinone oxidoreductase subunit N
VAGVVALARLVDAVAPTATTVGLVIAVVAGASIVLGNLAALGQADIRRLMAYSGVAHVGYLLLGVAALSRTGYMAAILYAMAYAVPSMGIMLVAAEEGPLVEDFGGLAQRRGATSWGMVVLLLSLIGVPPMIGFFGKFNLIIVAQQSGLTALVVIAVIASVVSAGYYFRVVRTMFFSDAPTTARGQRPSFAAGAAFALCVVGTIVAGLAAGPVSAAVGAFLH